MIDERFELIESIGSGGMASVWRATDNLLQRQVAIKRLAPHLAADPVSAARFLREARAAASLNHPGIVTVYDTGEDANGPYLVLELVEGETLESRLRREGPLSPADTAKIIGEAAAALDHAHSSGIVHRDIKPSNVMIDEGGRVRITDFGIARVIEDTTTLTGPVDILGTLAYMAPEVLEGEQATPASDVYSLGSVAYEMLTGNRPFAADSIEELAEAIRSGQRRPMSDVDQAAAAAITRAMAIEVAQRPVTATAFFADLMASTTLPLERKQMSAPASAASPRSTGEPTLVMSRPEPESGGRRWPWLAGLGVLLAVALLTMASIGGSSPNAEGTTIAPATSVAAPTTQDLTTSSLAPSTTTTTLGPTTAEDIAASISLALTDLRPPQFKPKEVRAIEEAMTELMDAWPDGDREDIADELSNTIEALAKLPDSDERQEILRMLTALAELMGFELRNE